MAKQKARKNKIIGFIIGISVVAVVTIAIILNNKHKAELYQNAYSYYQNGDYATAESIFEEIRGYSDADALANECRSYIDYETGIELFNYGKYAEAISYLQSAKGQDIDSYIAYCDVAMCVEEIGSETNLATIYKKITELNNFSNANQLFNEDKYLQQIKAIEGVWETRDTDSRRIIEIKDGELHSSYYYKNEWVTYDYDIYAYGGHLYAGSYLGSGWEHYDRYDINVNGSSIDWFWDTYKK